MKSELAPEIIYSINTEDVQDVVEQVFGGELSPSQLELLKSKLGDYIPWFDSVVNAVDDLFNM